jgi:predicted  nucleic acid-binding Zn-ribbon protein
MSIVDRFTRDRASRFIWGGVTLACAAVLVYAIQGERRSLSREVDAAETRARSYANEVIYNGVQMEAGEVSYLYRDLYVSVQAGIFTDPTVGLVRIWDTDGVLLFSTDDREAIGRRRVSDDTTMQSAFDGETSSRLTTEAFTRAATTGAPAPPTKLLQVFVPLRVQDRLSILGAVQVDFLYDDLAEQARSPWLTIEIVFAALTALFLLLTVLAFQASRRAAASVDALERAVGPARQEPPLLPPQPPALAEAPAADERVEMLERQSSVMREELQAAHEQLQQAEEAYRYLEGRLRQTQDELKRFEGHDPDEVDARMGELQNQLRGAEAALAAAVADNDSGELQERVREADERAAFLQDRVREAAERTASLQERAREAEEHAAAMQERLREADERAASMQERLRETDERTAAFESQLAEIRAELETARRQAAETPAAADMNGDDARQGRHVSANGPDASDRGEEERAEIARLRAALAEVESRASSADEAVASARADALAAKREAEQARAEAERATQGDQPLPPAPQAAEPRPTERRPTEPRPAEPEPVRRSSSDRRSDEVAEAESPDAAAESDAESEAPSPEATDLRARLARTAARKRLGSGPPD